MQPDEPAGRIDVLLVTGDGCKPCDHVKERLATLATEFPELRVSEVDVGSAEGTEIAVRYRLGGLPGVLINGRMALVGEASENLLRERLHQARRALAST